MKLKILSEAASIFYNTPHLQERPKKENARRKHARHVCQWVACDAGYKQSDVARFWNMDGSSVHYGRKMVNNRIDTDPTQKKELAEFMELVRKRISELT